jgi:hypothetical protein
MSLRYFLCLANSQKYQERCIAGVEVEKSGNIFRILKSESRVKWLRPITDSEFGAIPNHIASRFNLMDVVEIFVTKESPRSYQSENVLFEEQSLKRIAQLTPSHELMQVIIEQDETNLFGNRGKAVSKEHISSVTRSLMLIKPKSVSFRKKMTEKSSEQIRANFLFGNHSYDLPVTDPMFCERFKKHGLIRDNIYLTISLGLEHNGWHSKLVAGVIDF